MKAPKGVMTVDYALNRRNKPELRFRYKTRARLAQILFRRHHALSDPPTVVDFGAAEGLALLELSKMLGEEGVFVGVEYEEKLILRAPPLPNNVRLVRGDVTCLPSSVPPSSCDLVTALALLEHLNNPVLAVREAYRVLRKGGIFVATVPSPKWDLISTRLGLLAGGHHESPISEKSLSGLASDAGLEVLEAGRFMFAPVSFLPYLRIAVPIEPALALDRLIGHIPFLRGMLVNQFVAARKS